jgi:hypothetical protein
MKLSRWSLPSRPARLWLIALLPLVVHSCLCAPGLPGMRAQNAMLKIHDLQGSYATTIAKRTGLR